MIKIQIFDLPVRNLKGVGKDSGKPYDMNIQTAYAHSVDRDGRPLPVPEKFEIVLDHGQAPYAPGLYTLQPSALYVDRNGRLSVSPRLASVPTPKTI